jgi:gliding motility-associated-like protein
MKKKRLLFAVVLYFFLLSIQSFAQLESHLINGEGWLKGDFLEIGVNAKGVFGNNTANKPSSFHKNREINNNLFGFIANPKKDNWIDYDGDFFTPGLPEEGFYIEINGVNYGNNSSISTSGFHDIPGKIIKAHILSSTCYEDLAQIEFQGRIDNLNVERFYRITKNGLFIQMITSISNLSAEIKKEVYFMHNVDPDNNVTLNYNFATTLAIVSQPSAKNNIGLVKASQEALISFSSSDEDGSAISFYATDENARVSYGGFENRSASDVWNGIGELVNTVGSSEYTDSAMSIAFKLGNILPNETKTFIYYYILKEIDEAFIPEIINISYTSPTTCESNDGQLLFTSLKPDEEYIITYEKNGLLIPPKTYTADSLGNIKIRNLNAGLYANFTINFRGCISQINTTYHLIDPISPIFVLSKIDPTNCKGDNGQLILSGLDPNQEVLISYDVNGNSIPAFSQWTNNEGKIVIMNLSNNDYSNFNLEYKTTKCNYLLPEIVKLRGTIPFDISTIPNQSYCDTDYDFITEIPLHSLDSYVLNGLNETEYSISYHDSEENAIRNIPLSKTAYQTSGVPSYKLFTRLENKLSSCFKTNVFSININTPALFELNNCVLCLLSNGEVDLDYNLPKLNVGLDESLYSFQWFVNDNPIPIRTPEVIVDKLGFYSVIVTTKATGCAIKKEIEILASGKPTRLDVVIETPLFAGSHNVRIDLMGIGNYQYHIDDEPYQNSLNFENISPGEHLIYVNDINGCGEVIIEETVIDYLRFFTPNNDNINDTWHVIGIHLLKNPIIHIFDRYGKQIITLTKDSLGWNGLYNEKELPSNDYWFVLNYDDLNGIKKTFRAHFSLKR